MSAASVTAIIPAYNHEKYLKHSITSILNQTTVPTELIVVDDASTDGTDRLIEQQLGSVPFQVRFIRHKTNLGLTKTLNEALSIASGEYVVFLASDDTLPPDKIARQLDFLQRYPAFSAVYADLNIMDESGKHIRTDRGFDRTQSVGAGNRLPAEIDFLQVAYIRSVCVLQTGMFKTEIVKKIGGFDESLVHEDFDFSLNLTSKFRAAYLFEPGANYRAVGSGLNSRFREYEHEYDLILNKYKPYIIERHGSWRKAQAATQVRKAQNRILEGSMSEGALGFAASAIILQPFEIDYWRTLAVSFLPDAVRDTIRAAVRNRLRNK